MPLTPKGEYFTYYEVTLYLLAEMSVHYSPLGMGVYYSFIVS